MERKTHCLRRSATRIFPGQLEKSHFKMPVSDDRSAIPCISFPRWGVCQKCHILQKHPYTTDSKKGFLCKMGDSKLPLFHASFVQICDNGHIHEFPWDRWAHSSQGFGEKGEKGKKCSRKDGGRAKVGIRHEQAGKQVWSTIL